MKRIFLAAALAAGCATAPENTTPAPGGQIQEVREAFTCPLPASRGLITITRDGKAERVVFEGLEFELGKTKSTREQMSLSQKDVGELFRLVADSGWQKMPEHPDEFALHNRPSCADCCSGALMIKTTGGQRSLNYAGDRKPEKLEALIKGVDEILGRGTWTRVLYPWEKQR